MSKAQAQVLSGAIAIERGTRSDYLELSHLHYAPGHPTCIAGVWRAVYGLTISAQRACQFTGKLLATEVASPPLTIGARRVVGVAVLCYPVPSSDARERALGLTHTRDPERIRWLNAN